MKLKTLAIFSCTVLFFSCKKRSNSVHEYLSGSWRLTQVGADINQNGIMEVSEMLSMPDTGAVVNVFNGDGTGYGSFSFLGGFGTKSNFTWTTDERNRTVTITSQDGSSYNSGFFVDSYSKFHMLTNDLNIMGSKVWMVYERR